MGRASKTLQPVAKTTPVIAFPAVLVEATEQVAGIDVLEIGPHDRGLMALGHPDAVLVAVAFDQWARERWQWASAAGETAEDGRVTADLLVATHATLRTDCGDTDKPGHGQPWCAACSWPDWARDTDAPHTCDGDPVGCWLCSMIAASSLWLSWLAPGQPLTAVADADAYFPVTLLRTP